MSRLKIAMLLMSFGLTLLTGVNKAQAFTSTVFNLSPVNAACLSEATGTVTVLNKERRLGTDTLHLKVKGLPPNTDFAVFLTSADAFTAPAFGTTEYIGDFTTNDDGVGSLKVHAIINE